MKRTIFNELIAWKSSPDRKPLIIDGARQVGKTWVIKEFGSHEYKNMAYINCDRTVEMKSLFYDFDVKRLIRSFSSISNTTISPETTLIVLDEIQETPQGITALKYFSEDAPEYHIIVAGSLLGVSLHTGTGYPVGKVDEFKMYPMTFLEFLSASGNDGLMEQIKAHNWEELAPMSQKLIDLLRQYYYVGGMPEVVNHYCQKQDLKGVRRIQKRILGDYEKDFSKHVPARILPKVVLVWNSIPSQLAKESKKFIYGVVKKGSRAKDYEDALQWLINCGLAHKIMRVDRVKRPLKFYEDPGAFKLFMSDLGLLGAMSDVTSREVLTGENYFTEYKGAFTEQFVAQELIAIDQKIYYYSKENSPLEIDFLVQKDELYPIEVNAEVNLRSKSLRTLYDEDNSLKPCRFSMAGFKEQDWMVNVPLYLAQEWMRAAE
ncbi:MAG: ATP-binding protein [Butyrivibrio sp.]|nr:ATP-binding protein [Butyrivibrio sp.]